MFREPLLQCYFNSIKVQLKPDDVHEWIMAHGFQFHKGTIKTFADSLNAGNCRPFQFHKGTIKTHHGRRGTRSELHFNSIKVQLKPSLP